MRITAALLRRHRACRDQVKLFAKTYPRGLTVTVENSFEAASAGLDVLWAVNLLPAEGPGSRREFVLWCADQVAHLTKDKRVHDCLAVVRQRVDALTSVSDRDLVAAGAAAEAAEAAEAAAGAAAWAARDAQISKLATMLNGGHHG
jgi:hypothetical protein